MHAQHAMTGGGVPHAYHFTLGVSEFLPFHNIAAFSRMTTY